MRPIDKLLAKCWLFERCCSGLDNFQHYSYYTCSMSFPSLSCYRLVRGHPCTFRPISEPFLILSTLHAFNAIKVDWDYFEWLRPRTCLCTNLPPFGQNIELVCYSKLSRIFLYQRCKQVRARAVFQILGSKKKQILSFWAVSMAHLLVLQSCCDGAVTLIMLQYYFDSALALI